MIGLKRGGHRRRDSTELLVKMFSFMMGWVALNSGMCALTSSKTFAISIYKKALLLKLFSDMLVAIHVIVARV